MVCTKGHSKALTFQTMSLTLDIDQCNKTNISQYTRPIEVKFHMAYSSGRTIQI